MKLKIGNLVIAFLLLITVGLFLMSKPNVGTLWVNPWLSASQLISLLGAVLLGTSFVLSSRARFLESVFGGLDKMTRTHHMVGGMAFVMLVHHPLLLAVSVLPDLAFAKKYVFFSNIASYNYGVIALYMMTLSLVATFLIKLPYNLWIKTHDLMGITLMMASLHVLTISSDVSRFMPLRIWIMAILALGFYSFVYKVFLYRWLGPKYSYIVKESKKLGDIFEVYLEPTGEKVPFQPGQFGFVRFDQEELKEAHPFSYSFSPEEKLLRFSIKALGDYTLALRNTLKNGTKAEVWGSYGRMYSKFYGDTDVVCVAGGIGITPFLSMLGHETFHPRKRKIYLFYCAKSQEEAVYHQELLGYAENLSNMAYYPVFSDQKPRLTGEDIEKTAGEEKTKGYYLCGPSSMMENILHQLSKLKVKNKNIIMEDFSFK